MVTGSICFKNKLKTERMLLSKETKTSKGGSQVSSQSVQLSLLEATGSPSITQVGLSTHMVLWISPVIQGVY